MVSFGPFLSNITKINQFTGPDYISGITDAYLNDFGYDRMRMDQDEPGSIPLKSSQKNFIIHQLSKIQVTPLKTPTSPGD